MRTSWMDLGGIVMRCATRYCGRDTFIAGIWEGIFFLWFRNFASQRNAEREYLGNNVAENPPLKQDMVTSIPDPFSLSDWLSENASELSAGNSLDLFGRHPDKEFHLKIIGGPSCQRTTYKYETWFYQLKGDIKIIVEGQSDTLKEGECCIVSSGKEYTVERTPESIGMVIMQDPMGNKP